MKKKLLFMLSVCFSLFSLSTCSSERALYISGHDWQMFSESSKMPFIEEWTKCSKSALDHLPLNMNAGNKSDTPSKLTQESLKSTGVPPVGVTAEQIVNTINEIYSEPRVKAMDITEIMPLVNGRLTQGWTLKDLDEAITIKVKLNQCKKDAMEKAQPIEERDEFSAIFPHQPFIFPHRFR